MKKIYIISLLIYILKCDDNPTVTTKDGLSCDESIRIIKDCAESGTTSKETCENKGCCYKNYGENSLTPHCSYPATTIPITIPTTIPTKIPTTISTTIINEIPIIICKNKKCLECNEESNYFEMCISCDKNLGYQNVNYTIYKDKKIKYYNCHKKTESILNNFYYNQTLDQYRPCYKLCKTCSQEGNAEIHNCITCKNDYTLKPYGSPKNNCVIKCEYYLINAYEQYRCLSSFPCPEEAPYMIEDKKACLFDCKKDGEYIYLYNGKCVKECPKDIFLIDNICKVNKDIPMFDIRTFYSQGNITEEVGNLVESYSNEFNYTNNYVSIHKNDKYHIAIYKNLSSLSELSLDVPLIDFSNCYKKIQNTYNMEEELIIAIVDRLDQDNPNTSYSIYHPISGEKLDAATICKDETILITENHFIDKDDPNYDLKMSLIKQNINIFDSQHSFFNDFCFNFENSKKRDIALTDRIKYYYQKTNLCDEGCKEISFSLETLKAKCDCQYNDIEKEENKYKQSIKDNNLLDAVAGDVLDLFNSSNLIIVKCYKYIFKYFYNSFGAILSLILLCFNIFFTVLFFTRELQKIKIYIYSLLENYLSLLSKSKNNEPPKKLKKINIIDNNKIKKNIKQDNSIKISKMPIIKDQSILLNNIKDKITSKDSIIAFKDNKENIIDKSYVKNTIKTSYLNTNKKNKKFFENYLQTSLDDLLYDDAIVKDKRTFCLYFCDSFKKNQTICNTFCVSDPLKTRAIKIILFIFDLILIFVINALFISEDYISMLYHLEKDDSFFTFIPRSIFRFIKTTLVGELIGYVASFFFIEEVKLKNAFKREKDYRIELKKYVVTLINELKKRYISFIILVFIIILISFFYLLCFNYVYPYTQMEWIKTSIMVIIIRQILSVLIILIQTILRFLSFKLLSEKMFKFSKIFN